MSDVANAIAPVWEIVVVAPRVQPIGAHHDARLPVVGEELPRRPSDWIVMRNELPAARVMEVARRGSGDRERRDDDGSKNAHATSAFKHEKIAGIVYECFTVLRRIAG